MQSGLGVPLCQVIYIFLIFKYIIKGYLWSASKILSQIVVAYSNCFLTGLWLMKLIVSVSGAMIFVQTIRSCQFWEPSSLMSLLWHSQQLLRLVFKRMCYISWRWQNQNGLYCLLMFSAIIACLRVLPIIWRGGRGVPCQNKKKNSVSK